jgi:hypothetical protein
VPVDQALEFCEGRRNGVQSIHRPIRRVPAGVVLLGPLATGFIKISELVAFLEQFAIERRSVGPQSRAVNERRKPSFNPFHADQPASVGGHDETFSTRPPSDKVLIH